MSTKQAVKQIPATQSEVENFEEVNLTPKELEYFFKEVKLMASESNVINFRKAIHNAKYFAEIDRAFENIEAGHWTEHELIEVEGEDDLEWTEDEDNG